MPEQFSFKDMDALMDAQVQAESSGRPGAVSSKGAIGLAQIMPETGKRYGFTKEQLYNPDINRTVQRRLMVDLLTRYKGDVVKALGAYNTHPENIDKGFWPTETKNYVDKVLKIWHGGTAPSEGPIGMADTPKTSMFGSGTAGGSSSLPDMPDPYAPDPLPPEPSPEATPVPRRAAPGAAPVRRVPPPQPQNYDNGADYVKAWSDSYPGFKDLDHAHQERLTGHAMDDWKEKHITAEMDRQLARFGEKYKQAEFKGAAWAGGADLPSDPNEGTIEKGRDWWIQNVNKPGLRVAQAGIAALFQGPGSGYENWKNPGDHPRMRLAAHAVPILGAETPEQQALDLIMLTSDPWLKAMKIGGTVIEGSKFWAPAIRVAERMAVPAVAGAAVNAPEAYSQGSLMPMFSGAAQGAAGQATAEGASLAFGFARRGMQKLFETDIADAIAGKGSYLKRAFGNKLQTGKDFVNVFWRTETGIGGKAVSKAEQITEREVAGLSTKATRTMTAHGQPFEVTFQDPYNVARTPGMEGQAVGGPITSGAQIYGPGGNLVVPQRTKPEGTYRFTWDQAMNTYRNWQERGWGAFGDQARGRTGTVARSLAREMRNFMASQIANVDQRLGTQWLTAQTADEWSRILTTAFTRDGQLVGNKIDIPLLQRTLVGNGRNSLMRDVIETLGDRDGKRFLERVMQGGGLGAPKDVTGAWGSMTARLHPGAGLMSGHQLGTFPFGIVGAGLAIHSPTLPYHGGYVPFDVGRGAWGLITKLGGAGLFRLIQESLGDGEPYDAPTRPMVPDPGSAVAGGPR